DRGRGHDRRASKGDARAARSDQHEMLETGKDGRHESARSGGVAWQRLSAPVLLRARHPWGEMVHPSMLLVARDAGRPQRAAATFGCAIGEEHVSRAAGTGDLL